MNGPHHYAAAERRLEAARSFERGDSFAAAIAVAAAQAHATLALAAATIDTHDRTPEVANNSYQLVQTRARWVGEDDGEEITIPTSEWARALLGQPEEPA